jgi:hypothetical protein
VWLSQSSFRTSNTPPRPLARAVQLQFHGKLAANLADNTVLRPAPRSE